MPYIANQASESQPGEAQIQELANSTSEIKRSIVDPKGEQSSLISNRLGCVEERNLNASNEKPKPKQDAGNLNLLSDSFVSKDNKPRSQRS